MARVEPRPGSAETAPAALREKLVPMRDTPDRQLQLDFQRRAPELCTDCSNLAARASSALHDARLTSATGTGLGYRRFLPIQTAAPAASDAPRPLPRRRVNDTGLKCELGTPSSRNTVASPALADTTRWLARPTAPSAATDGVLARARQHSPTSAIDAKPEHTGKRSLTRRSAAFHGVALRLAALRRCEAAPTVQSGVSAVLGTEAGSGC